jgi:ribonuclease P protein component
MGLIVPKFHHTAVARNRLRRRVREMWRTEIQSDQGNLDLVIRARREAYDAPQVALKAELLQWRDAVRTAG